MNYEAYYSELDRAMYDKLWWLDKVEDGVDTILDFGCSNGAMYQSIHAVMPGRFRCIGLDSDEQKLADAIHTPGSTFVKSIKEARSLMDPDRTVLVLSSVIHELYCYLGTDEAEKLLTELSSLGCRHVVIRDMEFRSLLPASETIRRELAACLEKKVPERFGMWSALRGDFSMKGLFEFMLSYIHTANLKRELEESYFGMRTERILSIFSGYDVLWEHHFLIPYLIRLWDRELFRDEKELFSLLRKGVTTHTKLLMDKKR